MPVPLPAQHLRTERWVEAANPRHPLSYHCHLLLLHPLLSPPRRRLQHRQDIKEGHPGLLVTSIRQISPTQQRVRASLSPIPALSVLLGPNPDR
jgi:hypothetical protein